MDKPTEDTYSAELISVINFLKVNNHRRNKRDFIKDTCDTIYIMNGICLLMKCLSSQNS
jgi:hypothetical protein